MTKKEISEILGIDQNTIKNWERNRPELHKIVMEHFENNKTYPDFNNPEYRKKINTALGYDIIYQMNERLVIMPTAIVAAIILTQRKGISEDILVEKVEWLSRQLILRGAKIGSMNESSPSIAVRNAINHLEQAVIKTKKDIFELSVSPKVDYKNILLLSYYR